MARIMTPTVQPFYAAAERFVQAALSSDDSLFTPGRPIWTPAYTTELHRSFNQQPDTSTASFLDKFRKQLEGAPPEVFQLAGEIIFVHLIIATGSIGGQAKRNLITTVLNWSSSPVTIPADLDEALDCGLARVGAAYLTFRPFQLWFLIEFVLAWKQLSRAERERNLRDPWAFKDMLFSIPIDRAYAQREALLHIVHPDTFEPIVSREHKQRFARENAEYIADTTTDVDRKLLEIRENYARQHNHEIDFYNRGTKIKPVSSTPLPRSLGPHLRPYVVLVSLLDGSSYTPQQIVERLGRVSPPIVELRVAPDAEELVEDLVQLRLLKRMESGNYRRWSELDDATPEHMLRYAALTLLVPAGDGGYTLPALTAPFDGNPHMASEWPYGEELLEWYEEARLVQKNTDGTWQSLSGALEQIAAETRTARTLNAFLLHLNRVRQSRRDLPPVQDETLPVLDPTTLEERIAEIQRELLVDRFTILRIYRALVAGQHVILSGPPGTGKTHLARLIPRILWRDAEPTVVLDMATDPNALPSDPPAEQRLYRDGYEVEVVTATEDWGVRHVIGGIVPQLVRDGEKRSLVYAVSHGCLTRSVLANYVGYNGEQLPSYPLQRKEIADGNGKRCRGRWLVIDEFTRAPIDAAFGSLLTTLGGQRSPLMVPTDSGVEQSYPLPKDFRIIGTLNSFDRHFLNQISEAMKRRFTFIDVLPPGRDLSSMERAIVVYRAVLKLSEQGMLDMSVEPEQGRAVWEDVLAVTRDEVSENSQLPVQYRLDVTDSDAQSAIDTFWRIFSAVRIYRQIGTAQAESVCSAIFTGQTIGMTWQEALDSALADTLADQLQVLSRDEQSVLLGFLSYSANAEQFTQHVKGILTRMPGQRQIAHLAQLRATHSQIDETQAGNLTAEQLTQVFGLGSPLLINDNGLFARRLRSFISERGL